MTDTWPNQLKHNAEKFGDRHKAMRYKHYGIWRSYSWKEYYRHVKYLALGLLALGFKTGDRLLIVGDSAPEWYFAELAAQSNLGVSVGLYSDLSPSEIKYVAADSGSTMAMVEDQEQVDKMIAVANELPDLKKIIYWKYKGLSGYPSGQALIGYREVFELGFRYEKDHLGYFEGNVARGKPDDICSLVYTSGTTGENPKGVMHSYHTLRCGSENHLLRDRWTEKDNFISSLPPAWINEQWLGIGCHLISGCTVNFPESSETQPEDIREIGPTILLYSPRLWEKQASNTQIRIQGADLFKKLAFRLLLPVGQKMAGFRLKQQPPGIPWKILYGLAYLLLIRPLRDSIGLPHARVCYTTGMSLSPDVIRFYHTLNVPLKSIYGSTEAGAISGSCNRDIRLDSVGAIHRGAEVRIADTGEILVRQPGSSLGYYRDPTSTFNAVRNGWNCSGDSGLLTDEGHLIFIDRTRDIVNLSCGVQLAPQQIESRLKSSPFIRDAWVSAGPDGDYASAIVIIDNNNVGKWADKRKVVYNTYSDLSQKSEVYGLIEQEIREANTKLAPDCRIKKFVNLHKEFDADEFELTRNRKLRRVFLAERYRGLIQAIYSGKPETLIESPVRYNDGRTAILKTSIRIRDMGEIVL